MDLTLKKFKSLNLQYRKKKDTLGSNLTSVILGDLQNQLKFNSQSEEETILRILKSTKKSLIATNSEESLKELELVNSWLPSSMSEEEIKEYILKNFEEDERNNKGKFTGMVVKALKGKAEGSTISKVIKSL